MIILIRCEQSFYGGMVKSIHLFIEQIDTPHKLLYLKSENANRMDFKTWNNCVALKRPA